MIGYDGAIISPVPGLLGWSAVAPIVPGSYRQSAAAAQGEHANETMPVGIHLGTIDGIAGKPSEFESN